MLFLSPHTVKWVTVWRQWHPVFVIVHFETSRFSTCVPAVKKALIPDTWKLNVILPGLSQHNPTVEYSRLNTQGFNLRGQTPHAEHDQRGKFVLNEGGAQFILILTNLMNENIKTEAFANSTSNNVFSNSLLDEFLIWLPFGKRCYRNVLGLCDEVEVRWWWSLPEITKCG